MIESMTKDLRTLIAMPPTERMSARLGRALALVACLAFAMMCAVATYAYLDTARRSASTGAAPRSAVSQR